jgi:hypothetical protein
MLQTADPLVPRIAGLHGFSRPRGVVSASEGIRILRIGAVPRFPEHCIFVLWPARRHAEIKSLAHDPLGRSARRDSGLDLFSDPEVEMTISARGLHGPMFSFVWATIAPGEVAVGYSAVFISEHALTSSYPCKSCTGPRFCAARPILHDLLTFPESQRPTKQSISMWDGFRSRSRKRTLCASPQQVFLWERVSAPLRTKPQEWCARASGNKDTGQASRG